MILAWGVRDREFKSPLAHHFLHYFTKFSFDRNLVGVYFLFHANVEFRIGEPVVEEEHSPGVCTAHSDIWDWDAKDLARAYPGQLHLVQPQGLDWERSLFAGGGLRPRCHATVNVEVLDAVKDHPRERDGHRGPKLEVFEGQVFRVPAIHAPSGQFSK